MKYCNEGKSTDNFIKFSREEIGIDISDDFNFEDISVNELNNIRDKYFEREMQEREEVREL